MFDFELSGEDMATITALNRNERTGPDPDTFDMIWRAGPGVHDCVTAAAAGQLRTSQMYGTIRHESDGGQQLGRRLLRPGRPAAAVPPRC